MRTFSTAWLVTFDGHLARLFRCRRSIDTAHPTTWTLREMGAIANDWENLQEHRRPTLAGGSPGTHHAVGVNHGPEEEARRFMRDLAAWLEARCSEWKLGQLLVCANPRGIGSLRAAATPFLSSRIVEIPAELAILRESELAEHPAVASALAGLGSLA